VSKEVSLHALAKEVIGKARKGSHSRDCNLRCVFSINRKSSKTANREAAISDDDRIVTKDPERHLPLSSLLISLNNPHFAKL
jgi:hypothetical protein